MEPEQRTPREMTYRDGWKRGKIVAGGKNADAPLSKKIISTAERLNEERVWKEAPIAPDRLIQTAVLVLPAVLFILFVWMVYWLARFT